MARAPARQSARARGRSAGVAEASELHRERASVAVARDGGAPGEFAGRAVAGAERAPARRRLCASPPRPAARRSGARTCAGRGREASQAAGAVSRAGARPRLECRRRQRRRCDPARRRRSAALEAAAERDPVEPSPTRPRAADRQFRRVAGAPDGTVAPPAAPHGRCGDRRADRRGGSLSGPGRRAGASG